MTVKELQKKIQNELNKYTVYGYIDQKQAMAEEPCYKVCKLFEDEINKEIPNSKFKTILIENFNSHISYFKIKLLYVEEDHELEDHEFNIGEFYAENSSIKEQKIIFRLYIDKNEKSIKDAILNYINVITKHRIDEIIYDIKNQESWIQHLKKLQSSLQTIYLETKTKQ